MDYLIVLTVFVIVYTGYIIILKKEVIAQNFQ